MTAPAKPIDIGSLVTRTEGVYGGRPCLEGTRFPVSQVAVLFNEGLRPEDIVEQFMDLDLGRVYAGVAYYLANKAAVDADIEASKVLYLEGAARERAARGIPAR
jgi:uncharacterized protein (DUF433 family)